MWFHPTPPRASWIEPEGSRGLGAFADRLEMAAAFQARVRPGTAPPTRVRGSPAAGRRPAAASPPGGTWAQGRRCPGVPRPEGKNTGREGPPGNRALTPSRAERPPLGYGRCQKGQVPHELVFPLRKLQTFTHRFPSQPPGSGQVSRTRRPTGPPASQ